MRRFYIPSGQIGKDESIITGSDAHHLRDVLRLKSGDEIVVFDGTGREYLARVSAVTRQQVNIVMLTPLEREIESALSITVAQGYLKDKKMDVLVRQLTELGVRRWIPFQSRRSIPAPDVQRLQRRYARWRKISLEAIKQCGRTCAMSVDPVVTFDEVLQYAREGEMKLIFWEQSKAATLPEQLSAVRPAGIFVMLGPEGGFEAQEVSRAAAAGFMPMGLGPRILKAETATLAAAALVQFTYGDMG